MEFHPIETQINYSLLEKSKLSFKNCIEVKLIEQMLPLCEKLGGWKHGE